MTRFPRIRRMLASTPSVPAALAIAVGCALLGAVLRLVIANLAPTLTFVTFHPMVLICTLLTGWRAGTLCAALSGLLAIALFTPNDAPGLFTSPGEMGGLVAFILADSVIIAAANSLRQTVRELNDAVRLADTLNQELQHRVGNTMAVVQAMARQSARGRSMEEFLPLFEERVQALSRASRYLGAGPALAGQVRTLVEEGCGPFLQGSNIAMNGPDCLVPSDSCIPLLMALHELCTNAVKHGALSTPGGQVSITWHLDSATGELAIDWQEAGGPTVRRPTRKGLGSALLRAQKGIADVTKEFDPAGLRCRIRIDGASASR